ncbi:MAG: UTP--glucose-1-phosphate uridylyltransferase [Leptospiraceae bacterium]|nr:UTP--glucose-1-phosphate uridylyltransferase [Leptospiraceae bacterium]
MQKHNLNEPIIEEFIRRVRLVHAGASGKVNWDHIGDLKADDSIAFEEIQRRESRAADVQKLVVIKLNGGLGTTMGLTAPKSIIRVKAQYNFLQIIRHQIEKLRQRAGAPIPVLFMNSFNTREATLADAGIADINRNAPGNLPADFLQNMVPRLDRNTLLPIAGDAYKENDWCPPGHGDIYLSLYTTGILDRLLEEGYRVAFISNGDNLGALADPHALSFFLESKLDFASEVTPKTLADLKGGVLYHSLDPEDSAGRIELLETAQVPEEHIPDFQDTARFKYFNINNLWVNLEALRDRMRSGGLDLSLIVNPKQVNGRDVLQLETAMGAAIGHFQNTRVFIVPRTRFAPVKNCADLLVRRSDAYTLDEDTFALQMNPQRKLGEPVVKLDDAHYKKLDAFENLMPELPSLLHAESLEVYGPVLFDTPVAIHGRVKITNSNSTPLAISSLGRDILKDEDVIL